MVEAAVSSLFRLCWVFVPAQGPSPAVARGGYSSLQYTGFSLWRRLLYGSSGSRHAGFGSCSA